MEEKKKRIRNVKEKKIRTYLRELYPFMHTIFASLKGQKKKRKKKKKNPPLLEAG